MRYFRFLNESFQRQDCTWRDSWFKLSATCPYWIGHANKQPQLDFVKNSLFRRYCSNHPKRFKRGEKYPPLRGGSVHRHSKLYKFYWRLHAQD